jgi:hypothetical protein
VGRVQPRVNYNEGLKMGTRKANMRNRLMSQVDGYAVA